jgi:hypothetical protein
MNRSLYLNVSLPYSIALRTSLVANLQMSNKASWRCRRKFLIPGIWIRFVPRDPVWCGRWIIKSTSVLKALESRCPRRRLSNLNLLPIYHFYGNPQMTDSSSSSSSSMPKAAWRRSSCFCRLSVCCRTFLIPLWIPPIILYICFWFRFGRLSKTKAAEFQIVEAVSMRCRWTSNLSRRPASILHVFHCIDRKIRTPAPAILSLPEKVYDAVYCRWQDSVAGRHMLTEKKRHCRLFLPLEQHLQQQSDMNG